MRKQLASVALASLLALFLGACATTQSAAITDEAKAAIAQAEKDVKMAKGNFALWTTADGALKDAKKAAEKGDSVKAYTSARLASEHAKMGMEQAKYPTVEPK